MANKGVLTVIISCLLIHVIFPLDVPSYILNNTGDEVSFVVPINIGFELSLLLFPVFGLLADIDKQICIRDNIKKTLFYIVRNYECTIQAAFLILVITSTVVTIASGVYLILFQTIVGLHMRCFIVITIDVIAIVFAIESIGFYEASAIQLGLNQLLGASSTQLSNFIHWCFWVMHLGQQLVFCIMLVILFITATVLKKAFEQDMFFIGQT